MPNRREKWAIVLFATRGVVDFVENTLLGIKRCGIDLSLVQLVFPENARCELEPLASTYGARSRILEQMVDVKPADMPAAYVEWGTQEFNVFLKYRFPALRVILFEGYRVIHADIDIAWLNNPLSYLSDVLDRFSWACQTEPSPYFPPSFCLGFFALSPAPACLELIDLQISRNAEEIAKPDQTLFRSLLLENPRFLAYIYPLPEGLFPAGLLYRCVGPAEEPPVDMPARLEPFIFHANWCVGLENKRRLLAHAGAWFAPALSSG